MDISRVQDMFKHYNLDNIAGALTPENNDKSQQTIPKTDKIEKLECVTCSSRRYMDESNDPGVSFKTPTKLTPQQASTAVISHEREHYTRENAKSELENKQVLSNTIQIFTSICPECHQPYVSGGETTTRTRQQQDKNHFAAQDYIQRVGVHFGIQIDEKI